MSLKKIKDHALAIEVSPGVWRKCHPWETLEKLDAAASIKDRRKVLSDVLGVALTTNKCLTIIARLVEYASAAEEAYSALTANAEIMHCFPSVSMESLDRMSNIEKLALLHHSRRIEAKKRLDFITDISAVLDHENGKRHKAHLAGIAYQDDEQSLGIILEQISRRR